MLSDITVNIDITGIEALFEERADKAIDILYESAREQCPVDTGYMLSTISKDEDGVSVGADYAIYTEYRSGWFSRAINFTYSKIMNIFKEEI